MPSCDFNNFANCTCLDCKREREIWNEKIKKQKELIINECNGETWKEKIEKQKEEQEIKRNNFSPFSCLMLLILFINSFFLYSSSL